MPRLNSDPCFYATPADAVGTAPERHTYVAVIELRREGSRAGRP